jgi:hypothetical protein
VKKRGSRKSNSKVQNKCGEEEPKKKVRVREKVTVM